MINITPKYYDPETAPVLGRCECCGAEFYSMEAVERYDGLCEDCHRALIDAEDGEDEGDDTSSGPADHLPLKGKAWSGGNGFLRCGRNDNDGFLGFARNDRGGADG